MVDWINQSYGKQVTTKLTILAGYYCMIKHKLSAFEIILKNNFRHDQDMR
jgi:hypothetical protein